MNGEFYSSIRMETFNNLPIEKTCNYVNNKSVKNYIK